MARRVGSVRPRTRPAGIASGRVVELRVTVDQSLNLDFGPNLGAFPQPHVSRRVVADNLIVRGGHQTPNMAGSGPMAADWLRRWPPVLVIVVAVVLAFFA